MKKVTFLLLAMLCTLIANAQDLYIVGKNYGDWSKDESYKMTKSGNIYTYTFNNGISGEWKIFGGSWGNYEIGPSSGQPTVGTAINVGATYNNFTKNTTVKTKVTLTLNSSSTASKASGTLLIEEYNVPENLYLHYSGGGHSWDDVVTMTKTGETFSYSFQSNNEVNFIVSKSNSTNWDVFRKNGNYYYTGSKDSNYTVTPGSRFSVSFYDDSNNNTMKINVSSLSNITVTLEAGFNHYMTVTVEAASTPDPDPDPDPDPTPTTFKIYWDNSVENWATPYIHYWGGSSSSTYPGVAMTKVSGNTWSYDVPSGTTKCLFNAGDGDATKTANFTFSEGHKYNQSGDQGVYTPSTTPDPDPDPELIYYSNQQAVFFEKPSNWGTGIKIYIYDDSNEYAGKWGTTSMENLGNGIYRWAATREALPAGTKVIFSDGTNQVPGANQSGFVFVNGGYYTTSGYQRTISPQSGSAPIDGSGDMRPGVNPTGTLPVLYINTYDYELDAKGKAVKDKATGCYVKKLDDGGNPTQLFEVNSYDLPDKNYRYGEYWLEVPEGYTFAPGAASIGSAEAPLALEIKARGNYTREAYSKKPFKLKLDAKQNLLNMNINGAASKHWALLNGADDNNGYLRNYVGFMLGERIGLPWSPRQQPIEVVINGDYRGMYLLTESIRVGDGRVPISELEDEVTDLSLLSGGYLIEMDNYCDDPNTLNLGTYYDHPVYVTPDSPEVLSQEQKTFLTDQVNAMTSRMGQDALWSYMELDDAARYYIIMELLGHWEAYHGSTYMFRDYGIDQKWHFTPLWDCGHAFDTNTRQKYFTDYAKYGNLWIGTMRTNQKFKNKVAETWKWFMTNCYGDILTQIDAFATHVTSAAGRDHDRWSGVRRPTNCSSEAGAQDVENNSDMSSKASYVKSYLNDKVNWLKGRSEFGGYDSNNPSAYPEPTRDNTASAPLHPMYNPVTIKFTLPDVTVEAGQSADMAINYSSTDAHLTSIEADITVPEGLTLTFKSLSDLANGHTGSLTADATTEGLYHLAVTGSNTFTRANGTVAYLTVTAAADLEPATYAVSTSKVACTDKYSGSNTRIISAKKAKGNVIVTVTEPPVVVTLSSSLLNLAIGEEATLTATVTPEDLDDKTVTWSSDNEAVATVSADGKVTAVAKGNANITATCGEASATCVVSVGKIAQHIEWEQSFTDRVAMETSVQLTATASSGLAVTYTITNGNAFARISGSTLEAIAPGVVTVMASQMGNENYSPAESVSKTIVIWEGYTTGDLTGDGTIKLSDMIPVLDFLVGRYDDSEKPFNEKAADINGDGSVNIVDITLLIDMIMEQEQQDSTPSQIRRRISKADTSERAIITSNAPDEINITFTNINRFVAVHFDLVLPEDITVVQAECSVAGSNHNISFKDKDTYARFLLWGIGNPVFADDGYIHVKLSGDVDGDVTVNNITLNTGAPTYADDPGQNCTVKLPMATGIADIEADATEGVYYNLQGVRVLNPEHGIYIHVVDGKASRVAL